MNNNTNMIILKKVDLIGKFFSENYYPFQIFLAFILMLSFNWDFGFIVTFFVLYYSCRSINSSTSLFKYLLFAYILFLVSTGCAYITNSRPLVLFIDGIKSTIVPMLFYFVGNSKKELSDIFYKKSLFALSTCFVVSLYLFIAAPDWYLSWRINELEYWLGADAISFVEENFRLSGFWPHSYNTGYLSFIALCISYNWIIKYGSKPFYIFSLILSIIIVFLSQQRISIFCSILVILGYHTYGFFKKNKTLNLIFVSGVIITLFSLYFFAQEQLYDIIDIVRDRILSVQDQGGQGAINERSDQWIRLFQSQSNYFLGHGFNSGGSYAVSLGYIGVNDGEWVKLFYEGGAIGFLLFISLSVASIVRGIKYFKYYSLELSIIIFFNLAIIGANPFGWPLVIISYWYCMGRLWNNEYLKKVKLEKQNIYTKKNHDKNNE